MKKCFKILILIINTFNNNYLLPSIKYILENHINSNNILLKNNAIMQ